MAPTSTMTNPYRSLAALLSFACAALSLCLSACESAPSPSQKTQQKYVAYCGQCHDSGAANAPRKGDATAWKERLLKGKEALFQSTKSGLGAMPAAGGCTECSDDDLRALVSYISE